MVHRFLIDCSATTANALHLRAACLLRDCTMSDCMKLPLNPTICARLDVSARSAGLSPYSPSFGTSVGSCGFGFLARTQYPFWAVGALSTSNHYFINEPQQACGECFEVPAHRCH